MKNLVVKASLTLSVFFIYSFVHATTLLCPTKGVSGDSVLIVDLEKGSLGFKSVEISIFEEKASYTSKKQLQKLMQERIEKLNGILNSPYSTDGVRDVLESEIAKANSDSYKFQPDFNMSTDNLLSAKNGIVEFLSTDVLFASYIFPIENLEPISTTISIHLVDPTNPALHLIIATKNLSLDLMYLCEQEQ